VFLPLAGEGSPCGEPVVRRAGGCTMLTGAGEALLVRLGAGGGGATDVEAGGG
jgi:hypothetical protein